MGPSWRVLLKEGVRSVELRPRPSSCPRCRGACHHAAQTERSEDIAFVALYSRATQEAETLMPRDFLPSLVGSRAIRESWYCNACGQFEVAWADAPTSADRPRE